MKTKEQAIKEAYGKYFDKIKDYVDENGKVSMVINNIAVTPNFLDLGFTREFVESNVIAWYDYDKNTHFWQLKSLQGIEDNNGWIKIESDDDLPKETIKCIVCFFDGKNYIEGSVKYRTPELIYSLKQDGQITHYKPIEKIEPPIF